jgi:hypothetical protein
MKQPITIKRQFKKQEHLKGDSKAPRSKRFNVQ